MVENYLILSLKSTRELSTKRAWSMTLYVECRSYPSNKLFIILFLFIYRFDQKLCLIDIYISILLILTHYVCNKMRLLFIIFTVLFMKHIAYYILILGHRCQTKCQTYVRTWNFGHPIKIIYIMSSSQYWYY